MESSTVRYLFDTNAIRGTSYVSIKGKRSSNSSLETTSDIEYELGERASEKLRLLVIGKMSDTAYQKMAELVRNYDCVRSLLDYYNNKGVGDVSVIAYALTVDEGKLIQDKTIIVTNDRGVQNACAELSLNHISVTDFLKN